MNAIKTTEKEKYAVTQNACKLCTPLGACLALKGIEGALPLLHGSQGCATYIRRYMISHFKEPMDIASSNFSEDTAIFGGAANLKLSIDNIRKQYEPRVIGIPTTCLSETIGDDVDMILKEYREEHKGEDLPLFLSISTPSYKGTHSDGFHATIKAAVEQMVNIDYTKIKYDKKRINLFPGMVSPADIRYLKEIIADFGLTASLLADYSDSLDGSLWGSYQKIPEGGSSLESIDKMCSSVCSIEFGKTLAESESAINVLNKKYNIPGYNFGMPIGIKETDKLFDLLKQISGREVPDKYQAERGRLIDAYADGHKHAFGVRAAIYGEEDLVIGLAQFLAEIGIIPVICASGGNSGYLHKNISEIIPGFENEKIIVKSGIDFGEIEELAGDLSPDIMIGNSKGYTISRKLNIPLVRAGFPIHDRIGGQRILHLGYKGAQEFFDKIVNTIIESKQDASPVGYTYM